MRSDLANSVKDVALPDQDDAFLVTHLLAGVHEITELADLIAQLKARHAEASAIKRAIEKTLRARHAAGINFTIGKSLIQVPAAEARTGITVSRTEVLACPAPSS